MQLVSPWDTSGFRGDDELRTLYFDKLKARGFDLNRLKLEPSVDEMRVATRILKGFVEHPWVLFFANDAKLSAAVGLIVPVVFSLTYKKSAARTSNNELEHLFSSFQTEDFVDPREVLATLNHSTFVVHEAFNDINIRMKSLRGSMISFLKQRTREGKKYLMLASFDGKFNSNGTELLLKGISDLFGPSAVSMLRAYTHFMYEDSPVQASARWVSTGGRR
jgi:ribosomal protein L17